MFYYMKSRLLLLLFLLSSLLQQVGYSQTISEGYPFTGYDPTSCLVLSAVTEVSRTGQSFTPSYSGALTTITFWYVAAGAQSGDGYHSAEIYLENNPSSGLLSTSIDTFSFPTGAAPSAPSSTTVSSYTYVLDTPIYITAGTTYRFELRNTHAVDNYALWLPQSYNTDPYDGGMAYRNGDSITNGCQGTYSNLNFEFTYAISTLPISLTGFDVINVNSTALLTWSTASEDNNMGFSIEHSSDGRSWKPLTFIASKAIDGHSSTPLNYQYRDVSPLPGVNYYRLKQTDYNGAYEYSTIRSIKFDNVQTITVQPNPASHYITVTGLQGNERIVAIDALGRSITDMEAGGNNQITIDLKNMPAGVFYVRVINQDNTTNAYKVLKLQ